MPLRLIEATEENRPLMERLLQLYLHDVSEYTNTEPGHNGVYCLCDWHKYWEDSAFKPLLFMLRGKPAGFVLVRHCEAQGTTQHLLSDLFVLRCYRRLGIGEEVARMVFKLYPGRWEIEVVDENDAARTFWRLVMRRYTIRRYKELRSNNKNAVVFEFNSPPFDSPTEG